MIFRRYRTRSGAAVIALLAGAASAAQPPATAPARDDGTVVLFDGASWDGWQKRDGTPSAWTVLEDGSVVAGGGDALTREHFRDLHLHVEFRCPLMEGRTGQARGNSGVYLHGRYEVQVLDSHGQPALIDGCGAVYSVAPPLVNAAGPPETWQTYDIVFRAPRLDEAGRVLELPRVTVTHNGRVVQNNLEIPGPTRAGLGGPMVAAGPVMLQDHGDPVRYRNIWIRRLDGTPPAPDIP